MSTACTDLGVRLDVSAMLTHDSTMMTSLRALLIALAVASGTGAPAFAQDDAAPAETDDGQVAVSQGGESRPYLPPAFAPDMSAILTPPPALGTPGAAADEAVFLATRALVDQPRWALATRDANAKPKALLKDFGCALGTDLDPKATPGLDRLLHRVLGDVEVAFRTAKADVKRLRPLVGNDLPICVPRHGSLDSNPSYPSGHATLEYGTALILAELAPDRATAILQRGRTLAESRIVCGVHWSSDVQAGLLEGSSLVAALHGSAKFRADMDRARSELAASRAHAGAVAPTAGECVIEANAAAHLASPGTQK